MRMDLGLTQTIKQIQILSPQMYMSMEILCLNSLDLEDRIETELEENVALEISEEPKLEERETTAESGPGTEVGEKGEAIPPAAAETEPQEVIDDFNQKVEQWDRYAREDYDDSRLGARMSSDGDKDEKLEALNNTEGRQMSLQEYLEQQVHLLDDGVLGEDPEFLIDLCIEIIYNIDHRGYLMFPLDEIYRSLVEEFGGRKAESGGAAGPPPPAPVGGEAPSPAMLSEAAPAPVDADAPAPTVAGDPGAGSVSSPASGIFEASASPGGGKAVLESPATAAPPQRDEREDFQKLPRLPTPEEMREALEIVQSLDPPGVGGRDLKECLLLQLKRDGQPYLVETRIIENHLDDLAANRLPKIAKALGIPVEDVKAAAETVASLNPLPGKLIGGEPPRFIKPDVVVQEIDGHYEVRVESDSIPRLQISSYYRDLYRNAVKDPELKKFIKKKLESAEWLISAIRQRQSTLQRIAQEIVEIQKGFLDHGISHLKPLKMVEVAERVGVHVSTISRAISGKYIQTPRGIFDMKFFFTGGAMKSDGTMEARGSVIQRIKDLIAGEDKRNPLSDIDIVKKLEELDIKISRRTVTKYREAENLPSSRQRRSY